jgi:hypothetical protein
MTARDSVPRHSCMIWNVLRRALELPPQRENVPTLRLYDYRPMMTCAKSARDSADVLLPCSSSKGATGFLCFMSKVELAASKPSMAGSALNDVGVDDRGVYRGTSPRFPDTCFERGCQLHPQSLLVNEMVHHRE